MKQFKEFQTAWIVLILAGFVWIVVLMAYFMSFGNSPISPLNFGIASGVLAAIILAFYGMKTMINHEKIVISFGVGFGKKEIRLSTISSFKQVKNKWSDGLGIRPIENGTLLNIHGLTAIELKLKSTSKVIRIGTQKPELFEQYLRELIVQK